MGKKNYAYITSHMLKWARSETPFFAIEDVTERLRDISPTSLLKWENGDELPTITEAKKLAKLYDVPFACFYFKKPPPQEIKPYIDRRFSQTSAVAGISYELWAEIRRLEGNRSLLGELSEEAKSYEPLPTLGANSSVKDVALAIRKHFGIESPLRYKSNYGNNPFRYFRNLIERKGVIVAQLSGIPLIEIKGLSIYYDSFPIIGINGKDWNNSKVFTLMHEIAHLVRRSSSLCDVEIMSESNAEETMCNQIAAEVLMPCEQFSGIAAKAHEQYGEWSKDCLQAIAENCAVSTLAATVRLKALSIIKEEQFLGIVEFLRRDFNSYIVNSDDKKKGFYVKFFVRYLNQSGFLFPRTLLRSYAEGNISYGDMRRALGVKAEHLDDIERTVFR